MSTMTIGRTIHTGCVVTDRGNGYGRCEIHLVRVYKDGHDWHLLQSYDGDAINVLDDRTDRDHQLFTVTAPATAKDIELAEAVGYCPSAHYGYAVTRYEDGTASVSLLVD